MASPVEAAPLLSLMLATPGRCASGGSCSRPRSLRSLRRSASASMGGMPRQPWTDERGRKDALQSPRRY
eukprot:4217998-Lingulodinium_polyedra.AAC.1